MISDNILQCKPNPDQFVFDEDKNSLQTQEKTEENQSVYKPPNLKKISGPKKNRNEERESQFLMQTPAMRQMQEDVRVASGAPETKLLGDSRYHSNMGFTTKKKIAEIREREKYETENYMRLPATKVSLFIL